MKETGILFSAPMVRAVIDGTKTQTRRVSQRHNEGVPRYIDRNTGMPRDDALYFCPYGVPGDRLYVREAWRTVKGLDADSGSRIAERCLVAGYSAPWAPVQYEADQQRRDWKHVSTPPHDGLPEVGRYRHARFMPRWASRITLEITGVRVERLQDISEADATAEGSPHSLHLQGGRFARENFEHLWWTINGDGSWEANPWVWVVEFKRIEQ